MTSVVSPETPMILIGWSKPDLNLVVTPFHVTAVVFIPSASSSMAGIVSVPPPASATEGGTPPKLTVLVPEPV